MSLKIRPYKMGSVSAKALARSLGVKRLKERSRYQPGPSTSILNWGGTKTIRHTKILNNPEAVKAATNKLSAFRILKAANIVTPDFTSDEHVAREWQEDGFRVVARTVLNGHSGQGIVIVQPDDALVHAPLYTKYTKKTHEYRIHVFKGKIIDVCEKRKRNGIEGNSLVRTLNNGWVYCRTGVVLSESGRRLAISAVGALRLDFGAVDIIMKDNKFYVLEINTAPGIVGSTLEAYVRALRPYV